MRLRISRAERLTPTACILCAHMYKYKYLVPQHKQFKRALIKYPPSLTPHNTPHIYEVLGYFAQRIRHNKHTIIFS